MTTPKIAISSVSLVLQNELKYLKSLFYWTLDVKIKHTDQTNLLGPLQYFILTGFCNFISFKWHSIRHQRQDIVLL